MNIIAGGIASSIYHFKLTIVAISINQVNSAYIHISNIATSSFVHDYSYVTTCLQLIVVSSI